MATISPMPCGGGRVWRVTMLRRLVLLPLIVLVLASCGSMRPPTEQPADTPPPATGSEPTSVQGSPVAGDCVYNAQGEPAKPVDPPPADAERSGTTTATLAMTEGDVVITMDRSKAPCTISSFESLVAQDYYTDTSCHRLVDSGIFVLQCGDPTGTGSGGPGYTYDDELSGKEVYRAGTVAMANAGPGTNGSQFFLVYEDSPLPPQYTVFGQMDKDSVGVVARMAAEGQDGSSQAGGGKPNNPAEIKTVTVG